MLRPLVLLGDTSLLSGMYKLTNAMIYDHQPGDEIQYHKYSNWPVGPPWENYNEFIKHTFLSREENVDTIFYSVARFTFSQDSLYGISDTIQLIYQKNGLLSQIPYNKPDTLYYLVKEKLYIDAYFGLPLWSYSFVPQFLAYCGAENCWGYYDTQGPPIETESIHVVGLGLYLNKSWQNGGPPYGFWYENRIVYFKKNSISYGNEVVVGIEQYPLSGKMEIYPNPASDKLFIKKDLNEKIIVQVLAINGELLMENTIQNKSDVIDISRLKSGFYLVKVIGNRTIAIQKFIKN